MATAAEVMNASDRQRVGRRDAGQASRSRCASAGTTPRSSEDSWWDEWHVECDPLDRLVEVLHQIKWHHDGTLSFRRSCAHGICGSDAMLIDGRNQLACKVLAEDVAPKVTIEPIRGLCRSSRT